MALFEDDPMVVEAMQVFDEFGYDYRLKLRGSMMWVTIKSGKKFAFYPTTGRWAPYGRTTPSVHYRSKGARDFAERFLKPSDDLDDAIKEDSKKILPKELQSGDLRQFLEFIFEEFEDGKSLDQVYHNLLREHKAMAFALLKNDV